jgi:hypothetical protein
MSHSVLALVVALVAISVGLRVRRGADRSLVAAFAIAVVAVALHVAELLFA